MRVYSLHCMNEVIRITIVTLEEDTYMCTYVHSLQGQGYNNCVKYRLLLLG